MTKNRVLKFFSFFYSEICSRDYYIMSTPSTIAQLHARRRQLLSQIENLDQIRRGSITEQFVETVRKDGEKVRRGPYTLYSFKDNGGRTVSHRLRDPAQIAHYRAQIEAFRQFQQCTAELLALGEALSDRAIEYPEAEKKTPAVKPKARTKSRD